MKKIILLLLSICILTGCKIKRYVPSNYEVIEKNFFSGNHEDVIDLLNNTKLKYKEKTDWYYFFYGFSIYKLCQWNSHDALKYLKTANAYNPKDYNITCSLGEVFFDVGNYKKAAECFEKCINGDLYKVITLNKNPVLWLLLSELKIKDLNLDEFVRKYNSDESEELERVVMILKNRDLQVEDILYFIQSNNLSDREKLLVIDELIGIKQDAGQFIETLFSFDLSGIFKEYFGSRLIYYKLKNKDECFDFIKKLYYSDDFILNSHEYLIAEYFEKYTAFYYWLTKDYQRINSSAKIYYYTKKRVNSYSIKSDDDLKLFYRQFKDDSEFIKIQEYSSNYD